MAEETGTEQKLSPLERAKLAKAEAEKRKQEQAEQAEAERLAAEKSVEDIAREQAEQRAQAETKVGECRSIVDAKQVECDEIAAMAAEGGDDEFMAAMAEAQAEAQAALDAAQQELTQAESALEFLSASDEIAGTVDGGAEDETTLNKKNSHERLRDFRERSFGELPFDYSLEDEYIDDACKKALAELVAEVGPDPDLEKMTEDLKLKVEELPKNQAELDQKIDELFSKIKNEFIGFGDPKYNSWHKSIMTLEPGEQQRLAEFLGKEPNFADCLDTLDKIAQLNQDVLKLKIASFVERRIVPKGRQEKEVTDGVVAGLIGQEVVNTINKACDRARRSSFVEGIRELFFKVKNKTS